MPVIGMATSNFFLVKDVFQAINFAKENKFDGVEIWGDVPHCYVDDFKEGQNQFTKLQTLIKESALKISAHTPMFGINIASVNPGIRNESLRQVKEAVNLTSGIGSELLVLHAGKTPSAHPLVKEKVFDLNVQAIIELKEYAHTKGVKIALENCGVEKDDWDERLDEFIKLVDACKIGVCFDIGHAHCSWGLKETYEAVRDKIIHIHIHDNDKSGDQHLAVETGSVDYSIINKFLKEFSGMIVHENQCQKDIEAETLKSKENLDKMLGWE